jgi:hypothetical protein
MSETRCGAGRGVGTAGTGAAGAGGMRAGGARGVGRLAAMLVALVVVAFLLLAGEARAGTYEVAQCGWGVGADLDPMLTPTVGPAFYLDASGCPVRPGYGASGLAFEAAVAPDGAVGQARARWVAPSGTRFAAAHLFWAGTAQSGNWEGFGIEAGGVYHLLAYTSGNAGPAVVDLPIEGQAWMFEAFLQCLLGGPIYCVRSTPSTMRVSSITFVLEDGRPPGAQLGGALVASGWHRGTVPLELDASDLGAGVAGEAATIDGAAVLTDAPACATQLIENEVRATRMQPCPSTDSRSVEVDTTGLADGAHTVAGCATDFAGDQGCAPEARTWVDNSPPTVALGGPAEGEVSATVSDRYSGVTAGTISLRRADAEGWTDLPTDLDRGNSGTATLNAHLPDLGGAAYSLRVVATDVAGNTATAQRAFPAGSGDARGGPAGGKGGERGRKGGDAGGKGQASRSGAGGRSSSSGRATHLSVRLVASDGGGSSGSGRAWDVSSGQTESRRTKIRPAPRSTPAVSSKLTVDFATPVEVRGRLTAAKGGGVAGRPVAVVVRGVAGIGGAPKRRRVVTGRDGRFALQLPGGTSRRVAVSFHGGGGFAPAPRRSLALRVRAAVILAAEPVDLDTGESVRLHGRVRLGPARVSGRGKIVAIQYLERATGRWRPALVVRTDAKGHFDTSYRFRYVTGLAEIRLRATAPAEGGWPFARGSSAAVTVTVHGR